MAAQLRTLTRREQAIITRYRPQHGAILAPVESVQDAAGAIRYPLVAVSTLAKLESSGKITAGMRAAGEQFAALFRRAAFDGLRAADMSRIKSAAARQERARCPETRKPGGIVAELVEALGGHGSPAASVLWAVCGFEW